jgi:hypothetical protein
MRVNLKYNKKFTRYLLTAFNVLLIASFALLFLIYVFILGIEGANEVKILGIGILSIFAFFVVFNVTVFLIDFLSKRRFVEVIKNYVRGGQYDTAIEYLQLACRKKRSYSTNQIILFYLGYIELLNDNIEDATYYLTQFDLSKQNAFNMYCLATTIFLLYMIYMYNKDDDSINSINSIYESKKESLIRSTKADKEITIMLHAIEYFNNNKVKLGISNLKNCRCANIPFIKRFIEEK